MHPRLLGVSTVLFDLDDTLLENDMERFLPAYLKQLGRYVEAHCGLEAAQFCDHLRLATRAMMAETRALTTNEETFWQHFEALAGPSRAHVTPATERYYAEQYPSLAELTRAAPRARDVVATCLAQGKRVVIATNPVFPRSAILERVRWAGLGDLPFSLITSYETSHSTKPHVSYYREILERIGADARSSLMVGNDLVQDIAPAQAAGLTTYHVTAQTAEDGSAGPLSALLG